MIRRVLKHNGYFVPHDVTHGKTPNAAENIRLNSNKESYLLTGSVKPWPLITPLIARVAKYSADAPSTPVQGQG
jgi:hypothetical protein